MQINANAAFFGVAMVHFVTVFLSNFYFATSLTP